jgi:hypothetical protein
MLLGFLKDGVLTCTNCIDGFTLAFNDEQEGVVPLLADEVAAAGTFVGEQRCNKCNSIMFTMSEGYKATHGEPDRMSYAVVLKQTRYVLCHVDAASDEDALQPMNYEAWDERDFVVDSDEVVSIVNLKTGKTLKHSGTSDSPYKTPEQEEELRRGMAQIG